VGARLANLPPCRIGMEACVGAHHLSRTLQALGHDARLMPAKYVRRDRHRRCILERPRLRRAAPDAVVSTLCATRRVPEGGSTSPRRSAGRMNAPRPCVSSAPRSCKET
jgi:transposase